MIVKCQFCGLKDTDRKDMQKLEDRGKKGYIHPSCLSDFEKRQEFRDKENAELEELTIAIKNVHGLTDNEINQSLPFEFYRDWIQTLRNGNIIGEKGKKTKKYKSGVPYSVMAEAYEIARPDIAYSKKNVPFDTLFAELKYGFKIMQNKIFVVANRRQQKKKQKMAEQRVETQRKEQESSAENTNPYTNRRKKDDDMDISDLL